MIASLAACVEAAKSTTSTLSAELVRLQRTIGTAYDPSTAIALARLLVSDLSTSAAILADHHAEALPVESAPSPTPTGKTPKAKRP